MGEQETPLRTVISHRKLLLLNHHRNARRQLLEVAEH